MTRATSAFVFIALVVTGVERITAFSVSHQHAPLAVRSSSSRRSSSFLKTYLLPENSNEADLSSLHSNKADLLKDAQANDQMIAQIRRELDMEHQALDIQTHFKGTKSSWQRFRQALPKNDQLDKTILQTAIPSMINLAVVPIVNAVDTFWVGRMGVALALAGQAAANQAFFTVFFLVNYLPTITAPLVATAVGSNNLQEAQDRVSESLYLSMILGGLGMILLVGFPEFSLQMVLQADAPAMQYAAPYLRIRALSLVTSLVSATGFAAYRGLLDTVTPLKVSLATNLMNLVLDPLLMATRLPLGFLGAALATALSEGMSGVVYAKLLLKKQLLRLSMLWNPPKLKALLPLLQGGLTMLGRQAALNLSFVYAARRAQMMDPSGVSAAAYGIVMQIYSLGIVLQVAVQGTAAALVPSTLAKAGVDEARKVADRTFVWGSVLGGILGAGQILALPFLVPLFTPLPEVQQAIRGPAILCSILHIINGFVFAGEGVLLGLQKYRDLMLLTATSVASMVACLLSPLGLRLDGILWSIMVFNGIQAIGVVGHYLKIGPLAIRRKRNRNASMALAIRRKRNQKA